MSETPMNEENNQDPIQEPTPETVEYIDEPSETKPESEEDVELSSKPEEFVLKSQNVKPGFPIFIKINPDDRSANKVALPSTFIDDRRSRIGDGLDPKLAGSAGAREWHDTLIRGEALLHEDDIYRATVENPQAEWQQAIESQGRKLMGSVPQLASVSGEALSGERGALRFMRFAGLGTIFSIPLWHTGIWITLKTPSEARLLEFNREMITDKINLGRDTHGLALSAMVSAYSDRLLKVAMDHLYVSNLKTDKDLFDVISAHDIPIIIWGMACVIWNNGFQYERSCTHDPEKCNHIEQEKVDVTKLLWVNKNALTPWQVSHMSRRKSGEVTMEDVERYKKEMLNQQNRRVSMPGIDNNNYYFDLRVPTVREFIEHSNDWINSIVYSIERALEEEPGEDQRQSFITQNSKSTIMRQYEHWIDAVAFDDNTISDKETIASILEYLSSDDAARDKYMQEVKKYIDDSAVAVIGIPAYECSQCGGKQKFDAKNESLNAIIPLDILQTFFSLLVQKTISILAR